MTDTTFDPLITNARRFFTELEANNTRTWWTDHKAVYESTLKAPALLLLDTVADILRKETGQTIKTKLFRPHRDVRFSKDKRPYNTHLHMLWDTGQGAGYFLGLSHSYLRIGAGQMGFEKAALVAYRHAIDEGGTLRDAIAMSLAEGFEMDPPQLKRVPAPFAKDHPEAELLKRKGLTLWDDLPDTNLLSETKARFAALTPLVKALTELQKASET